MSSLKDGKDYNQLSSENRYNITVESYLVNLSSMIQADSDMSDPGEISGYVIKRDGHLNHTYLGYLSMKVNSTDVGVNHGTDVSVNNTGVSMNNTYVFMNNTYVSVSNTYASTNNTDVAFNNAEEAFNNTDMAIDNSNTGSDKADEYYDYTDNYGYVNEEKYDNDASFDSENDVGDVVGYREHAEDLERMESDWFLKNVTNIKGVLFYNNQTEVTPGVIEEEETNTGRNEQLVINGKNLEEKTRGQYVVGNGTNDNGEDDGLDKMFKINKVSQQLKSFTFCKGLLF